MVWMTFAGTEVMTVGGLDEDDVGTMLLLAAAATVDLGAATVKLLPVVLLLEVLTRFPPARLRFESDCCRTCTFCSDVGITDKLL